jgi:hypothetical protein
MSSKTLEILLKLFKQLYRTICLTRKIWRIIFIVMRLFYTLSKERLMAPKHSQIDQVVEAFRILQPEEPLDARTLSDLIDLTPKQVSTALSRLHRTGYIARVGSTNRNALYIRTQKPMQRKGSSIQREYKTQLSKRSRRNHTDSQEQDAKRILQAIARTIERELGHRSQSSPPAVVARQLTLFCR